MASPAASTVRTRPQPPRTTSSPSAQHRAAAVAPKQEKRGPLPIDQHPTELAAGEFGQWPNEVLDVLPDRVSGYAQDLMIRHLLRLSLGRKRRTGSAAFVTTPALTYSQLAKAGRLTGVTGAKTAADIMRDAIARGLVARYTADGELAPLTKAEGSGLEVVDKGGRPKGGVSQFCYRALWKNWEFCPAHKPRKAKDADVEVDENKETASEETEVVTSLSKPRPLKPGAKFKGKLKPDTSEYEVRSKDVEGVGAAITEEGTRFVIVLSKTVLSKTEVTTSVSKKATTENKTVSLFSLRNSKIPGMFRDRGGIELSDDVLASALRELGDCPLIQLETTLSSELKSIDVKKKALLPGFLVYVAKKCAAEPPAKRAEWHRAAAESHAIDERARHDNWRQRADAIRRVKSMLDDPTLDPDDRKLAEQQLAALEGGDQ